MIREASLQGENLLQRCFVFNQAIHDIIRRNYLMRSRTYNISRPNNYVRMEIYVNNKTSMVVSKTPQKMVLRHTLIKQLKILMQIIVSFL